MHTKLIGTGLLGHPVQSKTNIPMQENILQYSCSTHDYCEINFLLNNILWFIDGI